MLLRKDSGYTENAYEELDSIVYCIRTRCKRAAVPGNAKAVLFTDMVAEFTASVRPLALEIGDSFSRVSFTSSMHPVVCQEGTFTCQMRTKLVNTQGDSTARA